MNILYLMLPTTISLVYFSFFLFLIKWYHLGWQLLNTQFNREMLILQLYVVVLVCMCVGLQAFYLFRNRPETIDSSVSYFIILCVLCICESIYGIVSSYFFAHRCMRNVYTAAYTCDMRVHFYQKYYCICFSIQLFSLVLPSVAYFCPNMYAW